MKLRLLVPVITLAALFSTKADVLIYRTLETARTVGYDRKQTSTATGYLVIDWDTGEFRILRARTVNRSKQFTVSVPQGVRVYVARGPRNSTYTVISRYQEKVDPFTEVSDVVYGRDEVVEPRPGRFVYSPRTMQGSPKHILIGNNDDDVELTDSRTTSYYLSKETKAANVANQSVDGVIDRYRALLLSKGYYEVPDTQ